MLRRMGKELSPLWLPILVALLASAVMALNPWLDKLPFFKDWSSLLFELSPLVLLSALPILAALPFGLEFQHRTLPVLLSQPLPRSRIWGEKMLTLALVWTPLLGLAFLGALQRTPELLGSGQTTREACLLVGAFLLATFGSASFWCLVARSTIGGVMLNAASQFFFVLILDVTASKVLGHEVSETRSFASMVGIASLVYSGCLLWLGRRRFIRWQAREPLGGETSHASPAWNTIALERLLRCSARGGLLNLVRKELMLQKPAFLLAGLFVVAWAAVLAMHWLNPGKGYAGLLDVLIAFYMPLLLVLCGCVSLGEEKALGTSTWQLSLPIAAHRQWLAKFGVAATLATVLGFGLPFMLAWFTAGTNVGWVYFFRGKDPAGWLLGEAAALLFILSFWSGTGCSSTVRAALASVLGLVGLWFCALLASGLARWYGVATGGAFSGLNAGPEVRLWPYWPALAIGSSTAIFGLVALTQSLLQFRRAQPRTGTFGKYAFILAGTVFVLTFFWTDLLTSLLVGRP